MNKELISETKNNTARKNDRKNNKDTRFFRATENELTAIFADLTRYVRERCIIDKGVLFVRQEETGHLAAVSTWENGSLLDGLTLQLPMEGSLLERVAREGKPFIGIDPGTFDGNFFEKKLLFRKNTQSFVLLPVTAEGQVVGLVAYSSPEQTDFSDFISESLDKIVSRIAPIIERSLERAQR